MLMGACDPPLCPNWGFRPYVDCSRTDGKQGFSDECKAKGIRVVPSWTTPDGKMLYGTQGLAALAKECNCPNVDMDELIKLVGSTVQR